MQLLKSFSKDTLIYGIGEAVKKVVGIVLLPFYTRALSPGEYGILDTTGTFILLLSAIFGLGLTAATSRYFFLAETEYEKGRVLYTSFVIRFISGSIPFILIPFSSQLSVLFFNDTKYSLVLIVSLFIIFSQPLGDLQMIIYRYYRKPWKYILIASLRAAINPILGIWLVVYMNKGILGAQVASLSGIIIILIISFFYYSKTKYTFKFSWYWTKKMLKYGFPLIWTGLAIWLFSVSDRFFLLHFSDLKSIGLYSIGNTFSQPIMLINTAINMSSVVLIMSQFQEEKDKEKPVTKKFITDMWKLYLLISIPICLFISIFSVEIIGFITTKEYLLSAVSVPFLLFSLIFAQSYTLTGIGMDLMEKTKPYFWIMFASALINVLLNFIFIPKWGFIGASLSSLLSTITYFLFAYFWSQKLFYIKRNLVQIIIYILFCLLLSIFIPFAELIFYTHINIYIKAIILLVGLISPLVFGIVTFNQIKRVKYSFISIISDIKNKRNL